MPHRLAGRRLGRASDHRLHMLDNLAVSVLRYEKVRTTEAKAKEVRGRVDHMITLAKRGDATVRKIGLIERVVKDQHRFGLGIARSQSSAVRPRLG